MMYGLYREDPATKKITDRNISRTVRELRSNPAKGNILVFEQERALIGYAILIFYWSNEYGGDILHVDELYVKPEHRGRGIATCLFKQLLKAKYGAVALQLEVTPRNTRAMRYYCKKGFRKSRNDHLILTVARKVR
jgi:ribosomal protein S18 acetylase RimI-like enzyme